MPESGLALPEWLDVSRETEVRLTQFVALVEKWNRAINLVGRSAVAQIWERHVLDSAQLQFALRAGPRHWLDLGSGGGFPGLIVAILAQEAAPGLRMTLVESDARKATFLREASRQLGLSVLVHGDRIEALAPQGADVVSARALSPLVNLLGYMVRHAGPVGSGVFLKGAQHEDEIAAARRLWSFDLTRYPSRTDPAGAILLVRNVSHA